MVHSSLSINPLSNMLERYDAARDYTIGHSFDPKRVLDLWDDFSKKSDLSNSECYAFFEPALSHSEACRALMAVENTGFSRAVEVALSRVSEVIQKAEVEIEDLKRIGYDGCLLERVKELHSEDVLYEFAFRICHLPPAQGLIRCLKLDNSLEGIAARIQKVVSQSTVKGGVGPVEIYKIGGLINLLQQGERSRLLSKLDPSCYEFVAAMCGVLIQPKKTLNEEVASSPPSRSSFSSMLTQEGSDSES